MGDLFMGMTVKILLMGRVVSMKMMFERVMVMMMMMVVMIMVLVFAIIVMVMVWLMMVMMVIMVVVMMRMRMMVVVVVTVIMVENLLYQLFLEVNPLCFKTWEKNITQQGQ